MVRPIADLEGHPDIVELRARYDQVAETPAARITDGLLVLAGLYLAVSPWVVGFLPIEANLTVNNFICGVAVALLAAGFAAAYGRTHGLTWVPVVIGLWTIFSPLIIQRGYVTGGTMANNIVLGIVTIVLSIVAMRPGMFGGRKNQARGGAGGARYGDRPGGGGGEYGGRGGEFPGRGEYRGEPGTGQPR